MFGLSVDTLRNLRGALAQDMRIEKVLIYGSRAKGNYKTGSDIDITLIGKELTLTDTIYPLRDRLRKLYLPYKFDISIFKQLDEGEFIEHILRVGKTLYQRENGAGKRWEQTTLGEVCDVRRGTTITFKTTKPGDIPVVAGGLSPPYTHKVANRPKNTITISGSGAHAGFVNFYEEPIYASDCTTVTPHNEEKFLPIFVYRFLKYKQSYIYKNLRRGAAQPHVYPKDVAKIIMPAPLFSEQEQIVAILDDAFSAIDTAITNTKQNIANARKLFESQLEQAFTNDTASEEWEILSLDKLAEKINYGYTASAKYQGSGPQFLRITDIQNGQVDWANVPTCECEPDQQKKYRLRTGDIVFARTGATTGKSFLIGECPESAVFASYLIRVRPNKRTSPKYLAYYFYSPAYWKQIGENTTGSTQPGVNATKLKTLKIPIPPLSEQKRIVATLDKASANSTALTQIGEQKLAHLADLKQSLLHQAFTGELTMPSNLSIVSAAKDKPTRHSRESGNPVNMCNE